MKKVFLKKATCFLLILLMTMSSTIVICFAGGHERESGCSDRQEDRTLKNTLLWFEHDADKVYIIELYNGVCIYFNASPKNENDDISVEEFLQMCRFFDSYKGLSVDDRNEIFAYLTYCAEMNDIDI